MAIDMVRSSKLPLFLIVSFFIHFIFVVGFHLSPLSSKKSDQTIQSEILEIIPLTSFEVAPNAQRTQRPTQAVRAEGGGRSSPPPKNPQAMSDSVEKNGSRSQQLDESGVDQWPQLISEPSLEYPEAAKDSGQSGDVDLILLIDENGFVAQVKVFKGISEILNKHALKYSSALRFTPAMKGGHPIPIQIKYRLTFDLKNK
jgi:TonB family protein